MKKILLTVLMVIFVSCMAGAQMCNFTTYTLSPSDNICGGGTVSISLSGSQQGVSYQLASGSGNIGSPVTGTGAAISWTVTQANGGNNYVVMANKSGCPNNSAVVGSTFMNAIAPLVSSDVVITANPGVLYQNDSVVFTVTRSPGGNPQQSFKNFQLFDGTPIGSATTNNQIAVKSLPKTFYNMLVSSAICGAVMISCPAIAAAPSTPADTLAWLQTNIMQTSNYYIGKPFSVLMDTIQAHGMNMYNMDYLRSHISDGQAANTYPTDTVWTAGFSFFFKPIYSGIYSNQHYLNPQVNTNVPNIILGFTQQIPFPSAIDMDIHTGNILGPVLNIVRSYIISSIELDTW